jgi:hypothetical protein
MRAHIPVPTTKPPNNSAVASPLHKPVIALVAAMRPCGMGRLENTRSAVNPKGNSMDMSAMIVRVNICFHLKRTGSPKNTPLRL